MITPIIIPMTVSVIGITVPMAVEANSVSIQATLGAAYQMSEYAQYEGVYEVTPRLYGQSLETADKVLQNDVTIHQIPVSRVSNPYNGITVLIG